MRVSCKTIITILFSVGTLVHISYLGYFLLYPDLPVMEVSTVKLEDIEFPAVFKICLYNLKHSNQRYRNLGYAGVEEFFSGYSSNYSDLIGWNGFDENGDAIGTVEGNLDFTAK